MPSFTAAGLSDPRLTRFLRESLAIEGIHRDPTKQEMRATDLFLADDIGVTQVLLLQHVYAPNCPMRTAPDMNVWIGGNMCPRGGADMGQRLADVLAIPDAFACHVAFEGLHPFMDGNGRTGRAVWAWKMLKSGSDPFALSFLHRFYYQTLAYLNAPPRP